MTKGRKRGKAQHLAGSLFAGFSRVLRPTPPGHWLHRRLNLGRPVSTIDVALANLPDGAGAIELVFLSDLHAGPFMGPGDLVELIRRVNALRPDLVCFGGDLVDGWRSEEIGYYREALALLEAPLGSYAVLGNHDYYPRGQAQACRELLEEFGVPVLDNRGQRIDLDGGSLWLAGVEDSNEGQVDVAAALEGRRQGEPVLLLAHHPDVFIEAREHGVDLQLSGHTHGGQWRFFGWIPVKHSRHGYLSGLFREGDSALYVSRGVGTTVFPLRIAVPGEVALLRLLPRDTGR